MYQIDQYSYNIYMITSFRNHFQEKNIFLKGKEFCTYPPCHYFFLQIKCGFWSHSYLPLVTMSLFLLFFFLKSSLRSINLIDKIVALNEPGAGKEDLKEVSFFLSSQSMQPKNSSIFLDNNSLSKNLNRFAFKHLLI